MPILAYALLMNPEDLSRCLAAARELLWRHEECEREDNTKAAVRDFLIVAGLARPGEIKGERAPSDDTHIAVDLAIPHKHVYVETKLRVGTGTNPASPHQAHIDQIDGYVREAQEPSAVGVLTDGKHWVLRTPRDRSEEVKPAPYRFALNNADQWLRLFEWLRDNVFINRADRSSTPESIRAGFGPESPVYHRHIGAIRFLYDSNRDNPSVRIKRDLWEMLIGAALGEIHGIDPDDLFVRHTYLVSVVGMITQAAFGLDINERAANDPFDLVLGNRFRETTGLADVVESDFFSWTTEVPSSLATLSSMARHVGSYNWEGDYLSIVAPLLYQTVISPEERKQLGEYYTPDWLAKEIVETAVSDPLNQKVLDPACGSGTFLVEAIRHFAGEAATVGLDATEALLKLQRQVIGIDIHPVAVHLARASWVMAARDMIRKSRIPDISVPVYLGDSLQLLCETEPMLGREEIIITATGDTRNRDLRFPRNLVNQPEKFNLVMTRIAEAIHTGGNPLLVLVDHDLDDDDRAVMETTVKTLGALHADSLDHVWAYYARNLVRPISISESKVDVIVGNPPWLTYNKTVGTLREKLQLLSRAHQMWVGGRYATHQDIAGLFFALCVNLYLPESSSQSSSGVCSMVLPHSVLTSDHYQRWRTGEWDNTKTSASLKVDLGWREPWDLEPLDPNDFFPIPACVVHARRSTVFRALPVWTERWQGTPGAATRARTLRLPEAVGTSPYAPSARQGATVVPRAIFFIEEAHPTTTITAASTILTNPRRGKQDKAPWKDLDLTRLAGGTVEQKHVFDMYLGETVVPYATLKPLRAVLPITKQQNQWRIVHTGPSGREEVDPGSMEPRTRHRWAEMSNLWEEHKGNNNKLNLLRQLDYHNKLTAQLDWRNDDDDQLLRVAYTSSGRPTAAMIEDSNGIIDYTLFWIPCETLDEAHYLMAIINSKTLYENTIPYMPKGQLGPRHVQKHLWKLSIPKFNPSNPAHTAISHLGQAIAEEITEILADEQTRLGKPPTTTGARRTLRTWLETSSTGQQTERAVATLIATT